MPSGPGAAHGAGQPIVPAQLGRPMPPHGPPAQPPATQIELSKQAPPAATHFWRAPSQQPPSSQRLPSQQGASFLPHGSHLSSLGRQAVPAAVQKSPAPPPPLQHSLF